MDCGSLGGILDVSVFWIWSGIVYISRIGLWFAWSSGGIHIYKRFRVDIAYSYEWEQVVRCCRIRRSSRSDGSPLSLIRTGSDRNTAIMTALDVDMLVGDNPLTGLSISQGSVY